MIERLKRWLSDEVERLIDARSVACRKLRSKNERRGGRYTELTMGQLQKSEKEVKRTIRKENKDLRKTTVRKIRE